MRWSVSPQLPDKGKGSGTASGASGKSIHHECFTGGNLTAPCGEGRRIFPVEVGEDGEQLRLLRWWGGGFVAAGSVLRDDLAPAGKAEELDDCRECHQLRISLGQGQQDVGEGIVNPLVGDMVGAKVGGNLGDEGAVGEPLDVLGDGAVPIQRCVLPDGVQVGVAAAFCQGDLALLKNGKLP